MAWTNPRTWAVGENVTAALMNTHVRDNMLQTAPARVTTQGDIVFASGANALSRLGIAAVNKVLVGGANTPAWSDTVCEASNKGQLVGK